MPKLDEARAAEKAILANEERERLRAEEPGNPLGFNFQEGAPLPEGFVNPPCGEPDHVCLDPQGLVRLQWTQLYLERVHKRQQDPQPFSLGSRYLVPLETWCDVPPEIMESLRSAVEEHHEYNAKPGDIAIGKPTEHVVRKRKRFHWDWLPCAKVVEG